MNQHRSFLNVLLCVVVLFGAVSSGGRAFVKKRNRMVKSLFDIALKETSLNQKYVVKRINYPIPFYEVVYIAYQIRGQYGSVPSVAVASVGKPWFYVNSSMGGFDVAHEKRWTQNVLPFHLDAQVYRRHGAIDFSPEKKYEKNDVVLLVPQKDVNVGGGRVYQKGRMYSVLISGVNQGPFKSVKALLKEGEWTYPIELYARVQKSYSKSEDLSCWIKNMRYVGSQNPYLWPKKQGIVRGEYRVDEKGVLHRNSNAFFPITLYQYINQHESDKKTISIFKDFKAHGITGIHCNYVTLPLAYKAGFKYNTIYWGSAGGPLPNDQIIKPKLKNPKAWDTVFALSFDNEYIRYYSQKYQQSLAFVKKSIPNKLRQQLQGNFNATLFFVQDADLFGTYTRADYSGQGYRTTKLENLEAIAGTFNKCASIIQINTGEPDERFVADVMAGIAYGGTQVMYWVATTKKDAALKGREGDIRNLSWYNKQLPELRRYIDKMLKLNLIGLQPPATWTLTPPQDCRLITKAISVNKKNYLILVNLTEKEAHIEIEHHGLNLKKGLLIDVVTSQSRGTVDTKIRAVLPRYFYRVVEIKKKN